MKLEEYKKLRESGLTPQDIAALPQSSVEGLVQKIGGFLGMREFGKGIGVTAARATGSISELQEEQKETIDLEDKVRNIFKTGTPEQKERIKKLLSEKDTIAESIEEVGTEGLTGEEVLASAAQTGLSVVGLRGGLPIGRTFLQKVATGAATGAAFGGTESLKEGEGIVSGAVKGGIAGGILGGLLAVASKALIAGTKKLPIRLEKSILRQSAQDLAAEASGKKPILAEQLLEKGLKGSDEAILDKATRALSAHEQELQKHLERNQKTLINVPRLNRAFDEITRRKQNIYGEKGIEIIRQFKEMLKAKGDKITLAEANQLKRDIYKELTESAFNADVLPTGKEVLRTLASAIRKEMGNVSSKITNINAEEQFYIRLIDNLERRLNQKGKLNVLGLSDTIFAGAGISSGEPIIAAGTAAIKRAVESTQFKSRAAIRLDQVGKLIEKIPTDTAGKITKTAVMNALADLVNQEAPQ